MAEARRRPRLSLTGVVRSALGPFGGALLIGRQHGRIVIACDACGRTFEGDSDEWIDVWPQARREGWRVRKIGKDWRQFCGSVCVSNLADDQIRAQA